MKSPGSAVPDPTRVPNKRDIHIALDAEREFFNVVRAAGTPGVLVQHWTASELQARQARSGDAEIRRVASEAGLRVYEDRDSLAHARKNPFRDDIHPNDYGQQLLAKVLLGAILSRDIKPALAP
jgi:hypothetical protein